MKTKVLLLAAAIALAACGDDDPTGPNGVSGAVSFSYVGAGAANATVYDANGTPPLNFDNSTTSWAVGGVSSTEGQTVVIASLPKTGNRWDQLVLGIDRATVGSSPFGTSCEDEETCTVLFVTFGTDQQGSEFSHFCSLSAGTVTISAISSTNVTGTFSGTGSCITLDGDETPFTITNGSFNVGVRSMLL